MNKCCVPTRHRRAQAGFSMITTLILLVIATLLGMTAAQVVLMSERGGRYQRDRQIAFQAAESALLDAEVDIRGPSDRSNLFSPTSSLGFEAGCGKTGNARGMCLPADLSGDPIWTTVDFTDDSNSAPTVALGDFTDRTYASGKDGVQPAKAPRYLIELVPDPTPGISLNAPRYLYRVTAVGFGPRIETQVMLQMYFRKE